MSSLEKEIAKIKNNPKNVSFESVKKLLLKAGYTALSNGSSHWQFRKNGCETITIPYKRPLKAIYVKLAIEALESEK